jgi:hypothetical protein
MPLQMFKFGLTLWTALVWTVTVGFWWADRARGRRPAPKAAVLSGPYRQPRERTYICPASGLRTAARLSTAACLPGAVLITELLLRRQKGLPEGLSWGVTLLGTALWIVVGLVCLVASVRKWGLREPGWSFQVLRLSHAVTWALGSWIAWAVIATA